jgi:hypothetical protein
MTRNFYSRFVMHDENYFYSVTPGTPSCCSCAYWVATRVFNREVFMCPSDGVGACNAAGKKGLTPPSESCQCWQPWHSAPARSAVAG